MKYYFTADSHFSHNNILKYCNRPFANIREHDEELIRRWNSVVTKNDTVYHLGDFSFGYPYPIIQRLNFQRLIFIEGNHDRDMLAFYKSLESLKGLRPNISYHKFLETKIDGQNITLCHYSLRVWNKSHHGAYHLYGHSHGTLPDDPNSLSFDVGVDCHNYTPISLDQVKAIMAKKTFKPIDHHGR